MMTTQEARGGGGNRELLGYETVNPAERCCVCPVPSKMKPGGWVLMGVLVIVAFPIFWVPCVMPCFYEPHTRPVYGVKPTTANVMSSAVQGTHRTQDDGIESK